MNKLADKVGVGILLFVSFATAQTEKVSLTIYNNNQALVREVRQIQLAKGISEISFQDVAAQIDPTSVYFLSLTAPKSVTILEQNFEYDLVSSQKILEKYIDQAVKLDAGEGMSYQGKLLSTDGGQIVLSEDSGAIKMIAFKNIKNIAFPRLPEGLITRPTLVWSLDCDKAGAHSTEIGYLTGGIGWHAEYVAVVNDQDTALELSAWVSIDNKSGVAYKNAQLKVVAGNVHTANPPRLPGLAVSLRDKPMQKEAHGFEEESFFEYHLYTLQRLATVSNNQVKQISLFDPTTVKVQKKYVFEGQRDGKQVRVNLEFRNDKNSNLGIPLPKGKMRVYKRDDDKSLVFIGEDLIEHTPKDEKVEVYVGDAFDIVGERVQLDRRKLGSNSWEEHLNIKLRNHKDEGVDVLVREQLQPDWEILSSSHKYTKKDAHTVEFLVTVAPDKEAVVDYRVRYNR